MCIASFYELLPQSQWANTHCKLQCPSLSLRFKYNHIEGLFYSQKCWSLDNKLFGHPVHSGQNVQHIESTLRSCPSGFLLMHREVLETDRGATYCSFNHLNVRSGLAFALSWRALKGNWSSIACQVTLWLNLICDPKYICAFPSHRHPQDGESYLLSTCYVPGALLFNWHVFI